MRILTPWRRPEEDQRRQDQAAVVRQASIDTRARANALLDELERVDATWLERMREELLR